jgi:hypothetical protein
MTALQARLTSKRLYHQQGITGVMDKRAGHKSVTPNLAKSILLVKPPGAVALIEKVAHPGGIAVDRYGKR